MWLGGVAKDKIKTQCLQSIFSKLDVAIQNFINWWLVMESTYAIFIINGKAQIGNHKNQFTWHSWKINNNNNNNNNNNLI